jgi:hypothetical protein
VTTWILLLALVGADGYVTQIESVPGFASHEACTEAGVKSRAYFPVLGKPGASPWHRVDWLCVSTEGTLAARERAAFDWPAIEDALKRAAEATR